jgi:hypothetical protein
MTEHCVWEAGGPKRFPRLDGRLVYWQGRRIIWYLVAGSK